MIEGAEILEVEPEEAPAQPLPSFGGQGPGEGGGNDQRPARAGRPDSGHGHRIAQRKGTAVARRRDIHPCNAVACGQTGQIAPEAVSFRQEGHHRDDLPQGQKPQRGSVPGGQILQTDQIGHDRNREMGTGGMSDKQHLVDSVFLQGLGDRLAELAQPLLQRRGIGPPQRAEKA